MDKLDMPVNPKDAISYSQTDVPALVKAIQPTVFREGDNYYAVSSDEHQKHVVGKGISAESALLDWDKKLGKQLRAFGVDKDFARSVIVTYMAYAYELNPPKTDMIIDTVGLNLKAVEKYHLMKREPALKDRIYEILKRLGAEDAFLKVVDDMQKITPKLMDIVSSKIVLLSEKNKASEALRQLSTGAISYESLFQSLDDWTLEWDKAHARNS